MKQVQHTLLLILIMVAVSSAQFLATPIDNHNATFSLNNSDTDAWRVQMNLKINGAQQTRAINSVTDQYDFNIINLNAGDQCEVDFLVVTSTGQYLVDNGGVPFVYEFPGADNKSFELQYVSSSEALLKYYPVPWHGNNGSVYVLLQYTINGSTTTLNMSDNQGVREHLFHGLTPGTEITIKFIYSLEGLSQEETQEYVETFSGQAYSTSEIKWIGSYPGHPIYPQQGFVYFNTTYLESYIYSGSGWQLFAIGMKGDVGNKGEKGDAGIPGSDYTGFTCPAGQYVSGFDASGLVCKAVSTGGSVLSIEKITAGSAHTLFLKSDGTLWAVGWNRYGQLGDGTFINKASPIKIMEGVADVSAGAEHTLILLENGSAWAVGSDRYGELGIGAGTKIATPVKVMDGVVQIQAGITSSFFIKSDGTLWACGYNSDGELGTGSTTQQNTPILIATDVKSVRTDEQWTMFMKFDKSLWAMGNNASGQHADGTTVRQTIPHQVLTNIEEYAIGGFSGFAVNTSGTLLAWGSNFYGQHGDGTYTDKLTPVTVNAGIQSVFAGESTMFYIDSEDALWAVGYNGMGELGIGSNGFEIPISIKIPEKIMTNVQSVSAGGSHTMVKLLDGTVWGVGSNSLGQLGDGTVETEKPIFYKVQF